MSRAKLKRGIPKALLPQLEAQLAKCKTDPARFNETILCRGPYWQKQREICESVVKYPITCVKTGNGVGKSFVDSGIAWWFGTLHVDSITVIAAPTQAQLSSVLWSEMMTAKKLAESNGIDLGAKVRGLTAEFGPKWRIEGFGSGSVESKSGRHAEHLMALIDEASGVEANVHEAIDSLNPSRRLYTGNPIRAEGKFFELCESAGRNPNVNVIEISSLDSPHAHLERSPFGLADKGFLDNARYEYGEDSVWWLVHILGKFPTELQQVLLPADWIRLAGETVHNQLGRRRMAVDIAKGNDGDPSGILVRDDRGVLSYEESRKWSIEQLAEHCKRTALNYGVEPSAIVYDATGIGADFGNRLASLGMVGGKDYMGSRDGGEKYVNLRSRAGWEFRRRLDPARVLPTSQEHGPKLFVPQPPFSIPQSLINQHRAELSGCRYELDPAGRIQIEPKELFIARLRKSPTFLDCLFMSFAYPHL